MRKVAQQLAALRRVHDLGVEQHAVKPPLVVGDRGIGRASLAATARKPGGKASTLSPWLIHTCSRAPLGHRPSNSRHSSMMSIKARPNSWWSLRVTRPPSWAHIVCMP